MSGLLDSIIDRENRLDLEIIAEGIESSGQRRYLGGKGVECGQGWYDSKAIPAMGFTDFVRTLNKVIHQAVPDLWAWRGYNRSHNVSYSRTYSHTPSDNKAAA